MSLHTHMMHTVPVDAIVLSSVHFHHKRHFLGLCTSEKNDVWRMKQNDIDQTLINDIDRVKYVDYYLSINIYIYIYIYIHLCFPLEPVGYMTPRKYI